MAYDNTMKIEFYKPKYNLDIKFDGDDSFDLLFKNVSGELFFSANVEDYNSYVSFEDEECKFTNGELVAKVDISDLMETIANGQLRNTNGTTYGEWIPRIVGDYKTEHDLVFDGKTYADRGYWKLFFKEMSKDEIKDFIEFCRDYISIPNLEFSSRNFNYDDEDYIIISDDNYSNAHTYSLTINDDLTIEMAHKFICKSLDAIGVWESNHDYGDEFEEKKSLKESAEFFRDFGTGVYCATSFNGWTFCYCPLSWINEKGVEDLIGWSIMDEKARYIDGDSWENKTDEEINDSIDNFEKLIKKYAKEDAKEIIKDFHSTLEK